MANSFQNNIINSITAKLIEATGKSIDEVKKVWKEEFSKNKNEEFSIVMERVEKKLKG